MTCTAMGIHLGFKRRYRCSPRRTVFRTLPRNVKSTRRTSVQCAPPRNIGAVNAPPTARQNAPRTAREKARAELTREVKDVARGLIERDGAAALSLREVSRELGIGASTLYRYFRNRDDLLTALIIDAFNQVGGAAADADAAALRAGADCGARW